MKNINKCNELGIYIHIPFCKKRCYYCDFVTSDKNDNLIEEYISSMLCEIENIRLKNIKDIEQEIDKKLITSIFFGGGTPSFVDSKYIEKIIHKIKDVFNVSKSCEITMELNPESITEEKLIKYKNIGVNRISIGLQSSNNEILKLIGRIHTFEDFKEKYYLARKFFNNINIDIIFYLPHQDMKILNKTIEDLLVLNPEHISAYSLIVHKNSYMDKKFNILNSYNEDLDRKFYHKIIKDLEKNGYKQYEISNFSKSGYNCIHNLNCWLQKEYIGFGIAAASFFNNIRFKNIDNIYKYIQIMKDITKEEEEEKVKVKAILNNILIKEEIMDEKAKLYENLILSMRLKKPIDISKYSTHFKNIESIFNYLKDVKALDKNNVPTILSFDLNNYIINYIDEHIEYN